MSRLHDETGMGLPLAMVVLAMVMVLAGFAAADSERLASSSERDSSTKQALGPADAGIEHAVWQLSQTTTPVPDGQCLYSGNLRGAPVGGVCTATPASIDMGNGASFTYVASPRQAAGAPCAGGTVLAAEIARCVTATGTSGGVTRRIEVKSTATPAELFTPTGVVGKSEVYFNNSINFLKCPSDPLGTVGSNGSIRTTNSVKFNWADCGSSTAWSVSRGPGAPAPSWGSGTEPSASGGGPPAPYRPEPWDLAQIAPWPAANDNASLRAGNGVAWDAGTRVLTVTRTLALDAGTYDLCGLHLGNDGALTLNGPVKLYIDSPTRGTGCGANTGYLRLQNSNYGLNWPGVAKDPAPAAAAPNLNVFVQGNPALDVATNTQCGDGMAWGSVTVCNSAGLAGVIYAPNSRVYLGNNVRMVGAVAADKVAFNNSVDFRFPTGLSGGAGSGAGTYGVSTWTECTTAASASSC